jgi:hypothetical protein
MAQLDPADARLIADAANRGKISVDAVVEWVLAMRADPAGTRATIAKLAPWRPRVSDAATVVYASVGVEDALRSMGVRAPRGSVSAAAAPLPAPGVVTDSIGGSLSQIPAPVQFTTSGRPPAEWTQAERNAETVKKMFPWMAPKIGPAPGTAFTYVPTGNETHLPQQAADGSIEWVERPGYKPSAD